MEIFIFFPVESRCQIQEKHLHFSKLSEHRQMYDRRIEEGSAGWLLLLWLQLQILKSPPCNRKLEFVVDFIQQIFYKPVVKVVNSIEHFMESVLIPACILMCVQVKRDKSLPQPGIMQSCLWYIMYLKGSH